ncbi:MAG: diguanylate cyclase [Myxococcaceae bacterium]|nr:diguanylate cyclase [Myxococcaceae bacterium]MCI0671708.1 diguanylate cyclase [Myxococcaceae bacterium]
MDAFGPKGSGPGGRFRVLLAEDDGVQALALQEYLGLRFRVAWVEDGEAALRSAKDAVPDLILMDLFLPGLDGVRVFEALKRDARTADIPVIFLSGDQDEGTVVRCLELGAADYVHKPAPPRELVARMERALRQTRRRRALQALARTDALTGLANFRALTARLDEEFKRAQRYRHALAVVMVDLDHLKAINDGWGHDVGNRAIVALARHLRANLRGVDFAARFGGDEFVLLLPHQTAEEAAVFAERVRAGLGELRVVVGDGCTESLGLSISVGVAEHTEAAPMPSAGALLKAADDALYRAKDAGRDRIVLDVVRAGQRSPGAMSVRPPAAWSAT